MASEVRFTEVRKMLEAKGYCLDRIRGSHHVFEKSGARPFTLPVHRGKVKHGYVQRIKKLD